MQEIPLSTKLSTSNESETSALDRDSRGRKRARKAREERQVRRLLVELELADGGELLSGEAPDFVFQVGPRRVGIEVSMLFRNEPIEEAARRERIVSEARKLAANDHRFDRLDIWVAFGDKEISTVKEGAAALIRQLDRHVPRAEFGTFEPERGRLFRQFTIWPSESGAGSWRAVPKSELAEALTRDALKQAVAKKDLKVGEYRNRCTEAWLLLVLPLFPAEDRPAFGQWTWPESGQQWRLDTGFDRVFVYEERFRPPLHEIPTKVNGTPRLPRSGQPEATRTLHPEEREWLDQFREMLATRFADVVVNMVLYGSKARGDAREDSDIDVLLVVSDAAAHLKRPVRQLAHELAATSYALPSIVAYTEAEWTRLGRLGSPFRAAVERDGVPVL